MEIQPQRNTDSGGLAQDINIAPGGDEVQSYDSNKDTSAVIAKGNLKDTNSKKQWNRQEKCDTADLQWAQSRRTEPEKRNVSFGSAMNPKPRASIIRQQ